MTRNKTQTANPTAHIAEPEGVPTEADLAKLQADRDQACRGLTEARARFGQIEHDLIRAHDTRRRVLSAIEKDAALAALLESAAPVDLQTSKSLCASPDGVRMPQFVGNLATGWTLLFKSEADPGGTGSLHCPSELPKLRGMMHALHTSLSFFLTDRDRFRNGNEPAQAVVEAAATCRLSESDALALLAGSGVEYHAAAYAVDAAKALFRNVADHGPTTWPPRVERVRAGAHRVVLDPVHPVIGSDRWGSGLPTHAEAAEANRDQAAKLRAAWEAELDARVTALREHCAALRERGAA